jgi:hypothetical protein
MLACYPVEVRVVLVTVAAAILTLSSIVLWAGITDARLASSGPRRELTAEELAGQRGWVAVLGCVRHDLAVGVTRSKRVYKLGTAAPESEESDRVFTPLSARDDCDEATPPRRVYALVEDDELLANTITHDYRVQVAPPPVPAIVTGVVGYGVGHVGQADAARALLDLRDQPLIAKGRAPGVLWVALVTVGAGAHGFVLVALGAWWIARRQRRKRALLSGRVTEAEEEFFRTETLD